MVVEIPFIYYRIDVRRYYRHTPNGVIKGLVSENGVMKEDLFAIDNRIIHFFEHEGIYYLIRIVVADLNETTLEKYTHVLQIRFEPSLKE